MKLLVVDHNALEPSNRTLYQKIVERGGIELRLIVPSRWHNNFETLRYTPPVQSLNYDIFSSNVLFSSRTHRLIYLSLSKHLREFKPDILYINAEPENFQTLQAAFRLRDTTKLVFSSWRNIDHVVEGYPYTFSFLNNVAERYVLKRAAHGILFNRTAKTIFSKHGFQNTTVIPPPVDTELFQPQRSERKADGFVIGYLGRLVAAKGVDLILQSLASLPASCRAMIVGEGESKDELKQLAITLGVAVRTEFIDGAKPEILPALFAQMDVVVLPSRTTQQWREQFGRVLIEAMACGVPVLGSASGEIPNVVGDAGLLFKEGSAEGLVLGIERLLADAQLCSDLRARGLQRVREMFSLDVVAKQFHKLFTSL